MTDLAHFEYQAGTTLIEFGDYVFTVPFVLQATSANDEPFLEELLDAALANKPGYAIHWSPAMTMQARTEPLLDRG